MNDGRDDPVDFGGMQQNMQQQVQNKMANDVTMGVQAHMNQMRTDMQNIDYDSLRLGAMSVGE